MLGYHGFQHYDTAASRRWCAQAAGVCGCRPDRTRADGGYRPDTGRRRGRDQGRMTMSEIVCPHCGKAFTVDEGQYAELLSQVRTKEFEQEVHARLSLAEESRKQEMALAVSKAEEALKAQLAERDGQLAAQEERLRARESQLQLQPRTRRPSWRGSWRPRRSFCAPVNRSCSWQPKARRRSWSKSCRR